jgi:DNA-binding CsgD family transcriptional regulator
MSQVLLGIHLTAVIIGFIVLILSVYIGLRLKITGLLFFDAIEIFLIFNLCSVLVYREGGRFGWVLEEAQVFALKKVIYFFVSGTITIIYLFLEFLVYQRIRLWKWIASISVLMTYVILVFSPFFEIAETRTPLWAYYVYNALLFAQFLWIYVRVVIHRKQVGDKNMVRMANLFLVVGPLGMLYYYFLESMGRFINKSSTPMEYTFPFPVLFIFMNIAMIIYGFTRFTVKTVVLSGIKFNQPKLQEKYQLSARELEIIRYLCDGLSNRETGEKLYISELTVKTHVRNVYRKMEVKNRLELLDIVFRFKE